MRVIGKAVMFQKHADNLSIMLLSYIGAGWMIRMHMQPPQVPFSMMRSTCSCQ
jgi:hypothetical protein